MLGLAALSLAVDDVEVNFDGLADRSVPVSRHLHEQHALQDIDELSHRTAYVIEDLKTANTYRLAFVFVYGCFHFPDLLAI